MEFEEEEEKSRSQKKRDYDEIKNLAAQLVEMGAGQLTQIPLSDSTRAAIVEGHKMKKSSLKRQLRFIASRLDSEDLDAIHAAIADGPHQGPPVEEIMDDAERWGAELMKNDDLFLGEFVDQHPGVDRQRLRQLVRSAQKEHARGKTTKAAGLLIDYLKTVDLKLKDFPEDVC